MGNAYARFIMNEPDLGTGRESVIRLVVALEKIDHRLVDRVLRTSSPRRIRVHRLRDMPHKSGSGPIDDYVTVCLVAKDTDSAVLVPALLNGVAACRLQTQ